MAYETEYTLLEDVIQMLAANGDNKFSRVIEKVVNEAMKLERAKVLNAEPYERTGDAPDTPMASRIKLSRWQQARYY